MIIIVIIIIRVFGWDVKPLVPCVVNALKKKEKKCIYQKENGSPRCPWFNWQHIVPQHLVNHYMLLCTRSRSHTSNVTTHYLQKILNVEAP